MSAFLLKYYYLGRKHSFAAKWLRLFTLRIAYLKLTHCFQFWLSVRRFTLSSCHPIDRSCSHYFQYGVPRSAAVTCTWVRLRVAGADLTQTVHVQTAHEHAPAEGTSVDRGYSPQLTIRICVALCGTGFQTDLALNGVYFSPA